MKNITLVVLAAGMGSRFGGFKQIEPIGPNGEFIIDYSIYDAIKAGFNKIVFIVKKEYLEIFKNTIVNRIKGVETEYVIQSNDSVPKKYEIFKKREKPLGTAHAIMMCKNVVNEPFMIINADDFYGRDAFVLGYKFLSDSSEYGLIGYKTSNTLSENGKVKRGVCQVRNGYLTKIIESSIEKKDDNIIAYPLNGEKEFIITDELVSMNMLLFRPSIFGYIENGFKSFLEKNKDNQTDAEYLIPDVLADAVKNGQKCKVIKTNSVWVGITYREDLDYTKKYINELIDSGKYPK